MIKNLIVLSLTFYCLTSICAQSPYQVLDYLPADSNVYTSRWYEKFEISNTNAPEKYAEYFEEVYQNRYDYLCQNLVNEQFLFDKGLNNYIDSLLQIIVKANPELQPLSLHVLVGRSAVPNALSLGDGTFIFNLGLLRRLDNADQLAFVLCHEIAHVRLEHLEKGLSRSAAFVFDKDRKKEWKKIAEEEDRAKALAALQNALYGQRRHSRANESSADSLGLSYLLNTSFDPNASWQCLRILDSIDREKYQFPINLNEQLGTVDYPIKNRWVKEETLMFGGNMTNEEETNWDADSLRTHPNCAQRARVSIKKLTQETVLNDSVKTKNTVQFQYWIKIADYEMVAALLDNKHTAAAIYHSLKLQREHPNDPYLRTLIGRSLNQLHQAVIDRNFDDQIARPRSRQEEDWAELMRMLGRMRKTEFALLAKHYLTAQAIRFPDYLPLQKALKESADRVNME